MFTALATAIEDLQIGVDEREIEQVLLLRDRLDARITMAVSEFDGAELWDVDGSASMAAWLRSHAGLTHREAMRVERTARWMRGCPATAAAWTSGELDGGQVAALVGNVTEALRPLFQEREAAVLTALRRLDGRDTVTYLRRWAARAKAELERDQPDALPEEPERAVYLSPTLGGRGRLDGDLDSEGHAVMRTALRLAERPDGEGDPPRIPAQRRADALVDILRFYLDHQDERLGGRHRPHLNVVIDLPDLLGDGPGRTLDGLPLDRPTIHRLLCDAAVHRVITDGRSSILDYGRSTRTIPPAVYTSLVLRDLGCRFPGCDRPPEWCHGHHVVPWEHGGETRLSTLVLLCSRHHHRVHLPGWHLKLLPSGTVEVTAPDGRVRSGDPPVRC